MKYLKFGNSKNFIVFLHGWGADKNSFLWTKDYFGDYSLVYVDFPGFGESDEPDEIWSVFDYSIELKKMLDQFEIERLIIVAHSFGGRVAIKFSKEFQNNFNDFKLCLIDSAGIKPRRNIVYYYKIFKYKILKKIAKIFNFANKIMQKQGSSDYICLSSKMKEVFKRVVNEDLSCDAKLIKINTILIWGTNDKDTKFYMAKKLNRFICGSKLYIFKGAGHFSFLERKDDFLIILDTFIKS